MKYFLTLILFSFSYSAQAIEDVDPLLFGPEFTFWIGVDDEQSEDFEDSIVGQGFYKVTERMVTHLEFNQPEEIKFFSEPSVNPRGVFVPPYRFISPENWIFNVYTDPGVTEVTMSPMSLADFEKFADNIQDAVFVSHYNEGFYPALFGGGGHINMDLKWFLKRPLLLRNFIVDLINHNELSLGIFGYDTNNAFSMSMLPLKAWHEILWIIEEFDRSNFQYKHANDLRKDIQKVLANSRDPFIDYWVEELDRRDKFNEIRLHKNQDDTRIELRSVRAQKDIYTWVRQIRLISNRLKYLEQFDKPIPVKPILKVNRLDQLPSNIYQQENLALTPPVSAQEALQAFHAYVTEAGEKWEDHQDYIWPQWITDGELDRFNETLTCNQYLEAR